MQHLENEVKVTILSEIKANLNPSPLLPWGEKSLLQQAGREDTATALVAQRDDKGTLKWVLKLAGAYKVLPSLIRLNEKTSPKYFQEVQKSFPDVT